MITKSDLYFCVAKMPQTRLNTNDKLREMWTLHNKGLGSLICKEHFQIKKNSNNSNQSDREHAQECHRTRNMKNCSPSLNKSYSELMSDFS